MCELPRLQRAHQEFAGGPSCLNVAGGVSHAVYQLAAPVVRKVGDVTVDWVERTVVGIDDARNFLGDQAAQGRQEMFDLLNQAALRLHLRTSSGAGGANLKAKDAGHGGTAAFARLTIDIPADAACCCLILL